MYSSNAGISAFQSRNQLSHFFIQVWRPWRQYVQRKATFSDLGRRIENATLDLLSLHYLLQWVSIIVQQGDAAAIMGTAEKDSGIGSSSWADCM